MRIRITLGVVLVAATALVAQAQNAPDQPEFPKFEDVSKAVKEHLALERGYKPGDILSVRNVEPVFAKIEQLGWTVADRKEIVNAALAGNDYLVVQLRTNEGTKMMRKIGLQPMAYDYLDRIRSMPHGTYRIRELINGPDGYTMIEYMTSTKYGKNLTKMLTKAQDGKDFDKPTGRIYNEPLLLARLKASYDAEVARREGKKAKAPTKAPSAK